ncbi:phage integrase family protein [Blastococcus saxobsidens]|uniref:Phage integrase family protein n=1 Tax=Blastococcus saxobsidens TaxID=138336 RepID=A0A4Q7Y2X1_9ACTN|nr:phage integrase family protein [Blastococcus saxobsidens]
MKGSTHKRCGCRDEDGRQYGSRCPKLGRKGHGKWWGRYDAPRAADGKRRQEKLGPFDTKAEADAALADAVQAISRGTYLRPEKDLTVARYLDEWLAGKTTLKASTRHGYAQHLNLYLRPGLGHLRLADLRDVDLEALYAAMRQIGRTVDGRPSPLLRRLLEARTDTPAAQRVLSDATIRRVHATAMSALSTAVKRRKIAVNPGEHVELSSGRAGRALVWTEHRIEEWRRTGKRPAAAMVWTPEQAGAFLDLVSGDELYPLWHLVAFRGLRRSEALGLSWSDVDLDRRTVTVREARVQVGRAIVAGDTKSDTSARTVSLDASTLEVLRAQRRRQAELRLQLGSAWVDTGLVFTKADGSALVPDSVSQRFDRLVIRSGLPPVRLHDLRHLAASLTYRATKDLKLTSQMLGHASTAITEQVYTSVFEDVEREAAESAAALVPRAHRAPIDAAVPTSCPPGGAAGLTGGLGASETAGQTRWGGWGSNPRPRDYESHALTG